ncbi:hypothetical protein H0A64_09870 [Alcaligenaceae bacterium]|nr:hypothetical protein [Alcaligenaceae bacterium]
MEKRVVGVNDRGLRVGDSHHKARLTDSEVDLLLALRDEGWSYRALAEKFDISKSSAHKICQGHRRCQAPSRYKLVYVPADGANKVKS